MGGRGKTGVAVAGLLLVAAVEVMGCERCFSALPPSYHQQQLKSCGRHRGVDCKELLQC